MSTSSSLVRNLQHVTVYRDPKGEWNAAFPEIAKLANGELLVSIREARYRRPSEKENRHNHQDPDCRGSIIRSFDGGRTWPLDTRQQLTGTFPMEQCSVSTASAELVLFIYAMSGQSNPYECVLCLADDETCTGWSQSIYGIDWARRSTDGGHTWDEPTPLLPSPLTKSAIHAPMIELPDGILLAPLCGGLSFRHSEQVQQHPQCVVRSHDRGKTWGDGSIIALDTTGKRRYHQASLVRMPDGEMIATMHSEEWTKLADSRRAREVAAWLGRSLDDGRTWSPVALMPFRVTGSATSLICLQDGRLLFTWSDRHIPSIRIAISDDAGHTWSNSSGWSIREGEHIPGSNSLLQVWAHDSSVFGGTISDIGEPCTIQLHDGRIISVYYWGDADDPIRYIEAAIFDIA
ncbi:MAG: hypothetical protein CMJ20_09115 [Phycisphaeraceae bacterium]|nr:hypothetical protein [Phycisphaeraceae bacterium]